MSVLTDLIYGGSNAVAGLTEGAVNNAIAKYGADKEIAFPDTAYYFPMEIVMEIKEDISFNATKVIVRKIGI